MRRPVAAIAILLLAGCQKSFDDRYADAQKQIGEQAVSIDKELAVKASEAALGEAAVMDATSHSPRRGEGGQLRAGGAGSPASAAASR